MVTLRQSRCVAVVSFDDVSLRRSMVTTSALTLTKLTLIL